MLTSCGCVMSWDLWVFAADTPMDVDDAGHARFADDFSPSPLGTPDEVRSTLSQVFPALDWADPTWGQLEGDGFSIEFPLGDEDPCRTLILFARGNATAAALRLIDATGWCLLDTGNGGWMNLSADPDAGRRAFEAYLSTALRAARMERNADQSAASPPGRRGLFSRLFGR